MTLSAGCEARALASNDMVTVPYAATAVRGGSGQVHASVSMLHSPHLIKQAQKDPPS